MSSDTQDLQEFLSCGSDQAFRRIVERHAAMVHGVASRIAPQPAMAEEVTQSVFIILARKARSVSGHRLPGWLHLTARSESRNALRKEARRKWLNQQYSETMNAPDSQSERWHEIAPHLDEAVSRLSSTDRELIVRRYFENCSLREIARSTGRTEEACKKRAQRALKFLQRHLVKRGVAIGGATLAAEISAGAAVPPSATAATIAGVALNSVGTLAGTGGLLGVFQIMTTKQIVSITVAAIALAAIPAVIIKVRKSNPNETGHIPVQTPASGTHAASRPASAAGNRAQAGNRPRSWAGMARTKFSTRNHLLLQQEADKLAELVKGLSDSELSAGLDELMKLDVPLLTKMRMCPILIQELSKRDPLLAMDHLPKTADPQGFMLNVLFADAFKSLVAKDPQTAESWLKKQVSDGNLTQVNPNGGEWLNRTLFESALVAQELKADPPTAIKHILSLPKEQQAGMLAAAHNLDFSAAFETAMKYYDTSGSDSLVTQLVASKQLDQAVFVGRATGGIEALSLLIDRMPDEAARQAAHDRVSNLMKEPLGEGVPLELILEGNK